MGNLTFANIKAYLQGKIRYRLKYSRFKWLIRTHIREQIEMRINSMDRKCYEDGQCKLCGCETTALQMANKACNKPCYPKMMNKKAWNLTKKYNEVPFLQRSTGFKYGWRIVNNKFVRER